MMAGEPFLSLGNVCWSYPQQPQTLHLIWRKIDLVVCHLAGSLQKTVDYLKELQASWKHHGIPQHGIEIRVTCTNSRTIAYKEI